MSRARSYQQLSARLDSADSAQEWSGGQQVSGARSLPALESSLSGEAGAGAYGGSACSGAATPGSSRAPSVSGRAWPLENVLEHYPEPSPSSARCAPALAPLISLDRCQLGPSLLSCITGGLRQAAPAVARLRASFHQGYLWTARPSEDQKSIIQAAAVLPTLEHSWHPGVRAWSCLVACVLSRPDHVHAHVLERSASVHARCAASGTKPKSPSSAAHTALSRNDPRRFQKP